MVVGITNYLNEDIENVNRQIEKLQEKVGEDNLHVFLFHDSNYEISYHKYESFKNFTFKTENKNFGALYGRVQVINMIPDEFNNEFLIWIDADDDIFDIDELLNLMDKYKEYDYVTPSMGIKCVWCKLVKIEAYKKAIKNIKLYPGLRMRLAECNILTAALLDLCYSHKISYVSIGHEYNGDWMCYSGWHQSFDIRYNFDDECRRDILKSNLEELAQWIIWREIDKPGFDLSVEGCDHVYQESIPKLKELDKVEDRDVINKINRLVTSIVKDMPDNYREVVERELKLKFEVLIIVI